MRNEFLEVNTRKQEEQMAPWASKIVKVQDGYRAFKCINDYYRWCKQI